MYGRMGDSVSKSNKVHKRFCLLLIIMAFVGGALIEIVDNSTPDECEEGGALVLNGLPFSGYSRPTFRI